MALTGIDISNWQRGLNPAAVPADVVIMKATEGTGFVDGTCDGFYQAAKASGKLLGVYHFARNRSNSAGAEARAFLDAVAGYVHEAVLVLDWEDGSGVGDVAWARAWLDTVYAATGVRPLIYMSASVASAYAWEAVSADYGLWVAGYPHSHARGLEVPDCPYSPGHGWTVVGWQYTSSGRVSGWGGNLDLNVFYLDAAAWGRYASPSGGAPASAAPVRTGVVDVRAIQAAVRAVPDNVVGPDTRTRVSLVAQASAWGGVRFPLGVARTQEVVGTEPDSIWGPGSRQAHDRTVAAIQRALNDLGYGLVVDSVWGPHTEAAVTDALARGEQA